jgi:prepilin-type processing-associated H-X9-DG protein
MNIHQNDSNPNHWHTWDGASWVPGKAVNGAGIKTSQWDDASGTIFLFETWRNGGWQDPVNARDMKWAGGPMQAGMGGGDHPEVAIWQEKHLGKANLLFCDGHGATMHMSDTIRTQGITYTTTPTMNSSYAVRGMWTHAAGD